MITWLMFPKESRLSVSRFFFLRTFLVRTRNVDGNDEVEYLRIVVAQCFVTVSHLLRNMS